MANLSTGFAALADPTRRAIFDRIAQKPSTVGALALKVPVSRPAVSQHVKVLKDAGLVTGERVGTRNVYRLNPAGVAAMRDYLDKTWDKALAAFKALVEEE